jgi:hypothetical protein
MKTPIANIDPVLYIGLGGTGYEVITRLKYSLENTFPEVSDRFNYLVLDTAPPNTEDILSEDEFLSLSPGLKLSTLARKTASSRYGIHLPKEFLTAERAGSLSIPVKAAARLALLNPVNLNQYINRLRQITKEFSSQDKSGKKPVKTIRISIITSLNGSAGSGILGDILLLTGHYFIHMRHMNARIQILLADMHAQYHYDKERDPYEIANCYTTLNYLDHLYQQPADMIPASYPVKGFQNLTFTPDILPKNIYLTTPHNQNYKVIMENTDMYFDQMSGFLLRDIFIPVGITNGQQKRQMPLASFGVVRFGKAYNHLRNYYINRIIKDYLSSELAYNIRPKLMASAWLEQEKLVEVGADQLQDYLKNLSNIFKTGPALDLVLAMNDAYTHKTSTQEELKKQLEAIYQKDLETIYDTRKTYLQKIKDDLVEEVHDLLKHKSLQDCTGFLESLHDSLHINRDSLLGELAQAESLQVTLENEYLSALDRLDKYSTYLPLERFLEGIWHNFYKKAEAFYSIRKSIAVKKEADSIYKDFIRFTDYLFNTFQPVYLQYTEEIKQREAELKSLEIVLDRITNQSFINPASYFGLIGLQEAENDYKLLISPQIQSYFDNFRKQLYSDEHWGDSSSILSLWNTPIRQKIEQYIDNIFTSHYGSKNKTNYADTHFPALLSELSAPMMYLTATHKRKVKTSFYLDSKNNNPIKPFLKGKLHNLHFISTNLEDSYHVLYRIDKGFKISDYEEYKGYGFSTKHLYQSDKDKSSLIFSWPAEINWQPKSLFK